MPKPLLHNASHSGSYPSVFGPWPPGNKKNSFRKVTLKVDDDAVTATLANVPVDETDTVSFEFQSSRASLSQIQMQSGVENKVYIGNRLLARTVSTAPVDGIEKSERIGQTTYFFTGLKVYKHNGTHKLLTGSITVNSSNPDVESDGHDKEGTSVYRNFISGTGDFQNVKGFLNHESLSDGTKKVVLYIRSLKQ